MSILKHRRSERHGMVARSPRRRAKDAARRAPPPLAQDGRELGHRLRQARRAQGLTLTALAGRCGLSIGFISQAERGLATPSMRSLRLLAGALGLRVEELFSHPTASDAREAAHVVRRDRRRVLSLESIGMHMEIMTPPGETAIQLFTAYLRPGGISGAEDDRHQGCECGVILDGQLELWLDGAKHLLGPGDSFTFDSRTPHRYRNPGPTMTCIHWMITPPIY
jgi:transcriptional regulator with XRE-family HTH domain